jgi:hypothetical protein
MKREKAIPSNNKTVFGSHTFTFLPNYLRESLRCIPREIRFPTSLIQQLLNNPIQAAVLVYGKRGDWE